MEEQKAKTSLWSKISKSKKLPLFTGLSFLLIISILIGLIISSKNNNSERDSGSGEVAFRIDGKSFYMSEIEPLIQFQVEQNRKSKEESVQTIYDLQKNIIAGEKLGIKPSSSDIQEAKNEILTDDIKQLEDYLKKYDGWFELVAKESAVKKYINAEFNSGYQGYAFVFYFGQHIEYGDDYKPDGLNDQKLIESDRKYAKEQADKYFAKLSSQEISVDQAAQEVANDDKIKHRFQPVINPFGKNPDKPWDEEVGFLEVARHINGRENTGLSELQTGKGFPGPVQGSEAEKVELYYYFTFLEKIPESRTATQEQFDLTLTQLVSEFLYKEDASVANEPLDEQTINSLPAQAPQQSGNSEKN